METSPDRGLGVKSVSNRQGGPQPRTQALDLQLTTNRTHPGEGLLALSIWSLEGQVQSCGLLSHSWLQIRGLPQWPHNHRFSPKPPFGVFPSHQQGLGHDRGWCSPASGGRAMSLLGGGEMGLGAREYIHVAKAGSWGFQCHTQAVPRNGSSGGSPSAGLSSEPTSDRLALAALSPAPQCERAVQGLRASELTQLVQFVQCSSKAAEARGDFVVPSPGHLPQ